MAGRTVRKRKTTPRKPVKKTTTRKKKTSLINLKKTLNSVFIWALVVVNVVLIASMIQKMIPRQQAPELSSEAELGEQLKVEVLNGCGVNGIANTFKEILQNQNYDVVYVGNADSYDYAKSVVIDRGRRSEKDIKKFCKFLGVRNAVKIKNSDLQVDVRFIIGADYSTLKAFKNYR